MADAARSAYLRRAHFAGARRIAWIRILLGVALTLSQAVPVLGATDVQAAVAGSNSGSVPLVLLGLAVGVVGVLMLSPTPRRDGRDED